MAISSPTRSRAGRNRAPTISERKVGKVESREAWSWFGTEEECLLRTASVYYFGLSDIKASEGDEARWGEAGRPAATRSP